MKNNLFYLAFILTLTSCSNPKGDVVENESSEHKEALSPEDALKFKSYVKTAYSYNINTQEYQAYLDSALLMKPKSARLWQQKAMPLYKARKYSLGKPFLEKAALLDPEDMLDYSAFMKCLFSKEYEESITEFMECKKQFGDTYVMDHTYNFYLGLNYLQLNKFKEAKAYLELSKQQQFTDFPNDEPHEACHYLDWFYLGIADYELGNYEAAIAAFDNSLKVYTNFGDAMYYKSLSFFRLKKTEQGNVWMEKANENSKNTINEDQVFYEVYPYQIFNKLHTAN